MSSSALPRSLTDLLTRKGSRLHEEIASMVQVVAADQVAHLVRSNEDMRRRMRGIEMCTAVQMLLTKISARWGGSAEILAMVEVHTVRARHEDGSPAGWAVVASRRDIPPGPDNLEAAYVGSR